LDLFPVKSVIDLSERTKSQTERHNLTQSSFGVLRLKMIPEKVLNTLVKKELTVAYAV